MILSLSQRDGKILVDSDGSLINCEDCPVCCEIHFDAFNRANIGSLWNLVYGGWKLTNNELHLPESGISSSSTSGVSNIGNGIILCTAKSTNNSFYTKVTGRASQGGGKLRINLAHKDILNYLIVELAVEDTSSSSSGTDPDGAINLYQVEEGELKLLKTEPIGNAFVGQNHTIYACYISDDIKNVLRGTVITSEGNSAFTEIEINSDGLFAGLAFDGPGEAFYDDFDFQLRQTDDEAKCLLCPGSLNCVDESEFCPSGIPTVIKVEIVNVSGTTCSSGPFESDCVDFEASHLINLQAPDSLPISCRCLYKKLNIYALCGQLNQSMDVVITYRSTTSFDVSVNLRSFGSSLTECSSVGPEICVNWQTTSPITISDCFNFSNLTIPFSSQGTCLDFDCDFSTSHVLLSSVL